MNENLRSERAHAIAAVCFENDIAMPSDSTISLLIEVFNRGFEYGLKVASDDLKVEFIKKENEKNV